MRVLHGCEWNGCGLDGSAFERILDKKRMRAERIFNSIWYKPAKIANPYGFHQYFDSVTATAGGCWYWTERKSPKKLNYPHSMFLSDERFESFSHSPNSMSSSIYAFHYYTWGVSIKWNSIFLSCKPRTWNNHSEFQHLNTQTRYIIQTGLLNALSSYHSIFSPSSIAIMVWAAVRPLLSHMSCENISYRQRQLSKGM